MKRARLFFGDFGLLGLAVVFGWAIWYVVREDLNEVKRVKVQVAVETSPEIEASTPEPSTVTVEVQGPRRAVDEIPAAPRVVRRLTPADLPPGSDETRRDFTKDDFDFIDALGGAGLSVIDMTPPVVSVRVFRVEVQEKTVAPPEFQGEADVGVKHAMLGYTNAAKVRGAVSVLSTFREIRTFVSRERLQAAAESMRDEPRSTHYLPLEIDPAQRDQFTLVEPRDGLAARVELSRVARQEIVVPIRILEDAARASTSKRRLQFAEINKPCFVGGAKPQVKLHVTGVLGSLAKVAPSKIRAFVLESDLPDDQRNGDVPVHVADMPPGVALSEDYSVYVEEAR